jgi:hypothetical protein
MGRSAVHVSVNKALAVFDGVSKLLKTLRQRAQRKVRQRDAGQDIYFGRRNRRMIARVDPRLPDMTPGFVRGRGLLGEEE